MFRLFASRLRAFFTQQSQDAALSEEIETHLSLLAEEFEARGMTPEAARRAARREFGGIAAVKESARDAAGWPWFGAFAHDIRYAVRYLRHHPLFAVTAIGIFAVGLGGTTAIFSVFDAVVLRPFPYRQADRLYVLHETSAQFARFAPVVPVNASHFERWRRSLESFEHLALIGPVPFTLTGAGEPERVMSARVSPDLFTMLGVQPLLGRLFTADDDRPGGDQVLVLEHAFWQRRFGGDAHIIGRTLSLDGTPFEIIGVLPPEFAAPDLRHLYALKIGSRRPQMWKPFALRDTERESVGDFNFIALGMLRAGVAPKAAGAELNALQAQIGRDALPGGMDLRAVLVPLGQQVTGPVRSGLALLLAAVALVLLIVCVNVANLIVARTGARHREMAVRRALGASSGRIARQMLTETLLLSVTGGAIGLAVATSLQRALLALVPADLPRIGEIHLDGRILAFALFAAAVTGMLTGTVPAWHERRSQRTALSRDIGGRSAASSWLIGIEVALSAACLVAVGLLLVSYVRIIAIDRGFTAANVITVDLNLPSHRYPNAAARASFIDTALTSIAALPGIGSAAISSRLPFGGEGNTNIISPEGTTAPLLERPIADVRQISPGYFQTLGIPIHDGRIFNRQDEKRRVAVLSARAAELLWPRQRAVGQRLHIGNNDTPVEVIGIVGDVRAVGLEKEPSPTVYIPFWQNVSTEIAIAVRTDGGGIASAPDIRRTIAALDRELPVPPPRSFEATVSDALAQRRFQLLLMGIFAGVAVVLTALGVFGVVAYAVSQRTSELGVRLALGASPAQLVRLIMAQTWPSIGIGLLCGLPAGVAAGATFRGLLYGVEPYNVPVLAGACALLAAIGGLAAFLPAYRASRVDPLAALRAE